MRSLPKATVLVAMTLLTLSAAQPRQAPKQLLSAKCVTPLSSGSRTLTDTIQKYLKNVGSYEIPIVAVQEAGDTTHYIISALIATYHIKKNPPTSIVKFAGREALLYTGKEAISQTAPDCFEALLKKYSKVLDADVLNRRNGVAPDKARTLIYDPILKDIAVSRSGHVTVKSADRFPYITYE